MRRHHVESLEARRLLAAFGTPVESYGAHGGGTVVNVPNGLNNPAELLIDASGRTLAFTDSTVTRYRTNGRLDTSFDSDGKVALPPNLHVFDGALDAAGNVYVFADEFKSVKSFGGMLYRYTPDGALDIAWAAGGFTKITRNANVNGGQIVVQSDGKVIVAATLGKFFEETSTTTVLRFDIDGSLDGSFGTRGHVDLTLSPADPIHKTSSDGVRDVAVVTGGRILIIGGGRAITPAHEDANGNFVPTEGGDAQFVAVKMNSNGSFDRTFSDGSGFLRRPDGFARGGQILADGSFALGGYDSAQRPIVSVFEADGSRRWQATAPRQLRMETINDLVALDDGRVAVAGYDITSSFDSTLTLAYASADGTISAGVNPGLTSVVPAGSARLATPGGALFVLDEDSRDLDSDEPHRQLMLKIDTGSADVRPDQFTNAGAADLDLSFDASAEIAYYDTKARRLMYTHRDGNGFWLTPEVVDSHARAGEQLSIVEDDPSQPWIAYYDGANGDLKIAHRETNATWSPTTIDSRGNTGLHPSAVNNGAGAPGVAYYDATNGALRFAFRTSKGIWNTENIAAVSDGGGRSLSMRTAFIGGRSTWRLAYADAEGNINYAVRRGNNDWTITRVVATGNANGADFISLSRNGSAISFYDVANGDLQLAYNTSKGWRTRTIASNGVEGLYSHIVRHGDFEEYILSYNRSADRLSAFKLNPSDYAAAGTRTVVASGFGQQAAGASAFFYGNQSTDNVMVFGFDSKLGKFRVLDAVLE